MNGCGAAAHRGAGGHGRVRTAAPCAAEARSDRYAGGRSAARADAIAPKGPLTVRGQAWHSGAGVPECAGVPGGHACGGTAKSAVRADER